MSNVGRHLGEVDAFLVQPFDENKSLREAAVLKALENALPGVRVNLRTSDDELAESNWLREEVFAKLASADIVVVDSFPVSGEPFGRPNVYLEMGFGIGIDKPTLLIESSQKNRHSDLAGILAVRLDPNLNEGERYDALVRKLVEDLGRGLPHRILQARLRRSAVEMLPLMARHVGVYPKFSGRIWPGFIAQGAGRAGLRVFVDEEVPSDLILEAWNGDSTRIAFAAGWIRNPEGRWQGDVLVADARAVIEAAKAEGLSTIRVKLKPWEGPSFD